MAHSFFAEIGGFLYRNKRGQFRRINAVDFLELCEGRNYQSDYYGQRNQGQEQMGKGILALQLVWFMVQVVVRGSRGLAVTLVELDTVCMAVLSLIVIALWWEKPFCPAYPHVFYSTQVVDESGMAVMPPAKANLLEAWKPEPIFPGWLTACLTCTHKHDDDGTGTMFLHESSPSITSKVSELLEATREDFTEGLVTVTWLILGGMHLIAWDFEFPTETEKILWRVASLVLAGASLVFFGVWFISFVLGWVDSDVSFWFYDVIMWKVVWPPVGFLGIVSRVLLLCLMLASLRALPCSAHDTVPWTLYIPHL